MLQPPGHQDLKLLPHRIKWLSEANPLGTYALVPKEDITTGFETITYWDLAVAINRAAWWLKANLKDDEECFAYRGPRDLRWSALLVGAIIAGKTMVHISPWTCTETILGSSQCSVVVDGNNSSTTGCDSNSRYRQLTVPSFQNWFKYSYTELPSLTYSGSWEESADKEVAIFYALSVSGNLEPIRWSNRRIASWDAILELAKKDHSVLVPDVIGKTVFNAFNPAQLEGQTFQLLLPIYFGNPVVLGHPDQLLDPAAVQQILMHASCTGIITSPGLLDELTECPRTLAQLRSLESVVVVGTELPEQSYELLNGPGANVQNFYGCPTLFPLVQQRPQPHNTPYVSFHQYSGAAFRPHSSGFKELVVVRDEKYLNYQGHFTCQPKSDIHTTGDLFSKQHASPEYWRFERRSNDSIILKGGEHVAVAETERIIGTHLLVKSAIILGNQRIRPVLVIEPWSDAMASLKYGRFEQDFIEEIWSHVEEANQLRSDSSKLCQRLTYIMKTPFVRTNQSTIDRKRTEGMIKDEINELYAGYERSSEPVLEEKKVKNIKHPRTRGEEIQRNLRFLQTFRDVHAI